MKKILLLSLIMLLAGCSPEAVVADAFWEDEPAPWEEVDAFYYPNKHNLNIVESQPGLKTLDECRAWVQDRADQNNDRSLPRFIGTPCFISRNIVSTASLSPGISVTRH